MQRPGVARAALVAAAVAVVAALTLPSSFGDVSSNDPSWRVGLELAARDGLVFGRDVVFTYGPVGRLATATGAVPQLVAAGAAYALVLHASLAALVVIGLARAAIPMAARIVLAAASLPLLRALASGNHADAALVALAAAALAASTASATRPRQGAVYAAAAAGGAIAGIHVLVKTNVGATLAVVVVLGAAATSAGGAWRRAAAGAVAAVAVCLGILLGWVAAAQPIGALPDFLVRAAQVASGYDRAMGTGSHGLPLLLGLVGLAGAALVVGAAVLARSRPERALLGLAFAALAFAQWKHAAVRGDVHLLAPAAAALVVAVAVLGARWPRRGPLPRERAAAPAPAVAGALAAAVAASAVLASNPWGRALAHPREIRAGAAEVRWALSPQRAEANAARLREGERAFAQVPDGMVERIRRSGTGVHVEPWEISAVWAYGLRWSPTPVVQSYSAYTAELDALGAEHLASADGPGWILVDRTPPGAIDGRRPLWEPPATTLERICRYREVDRGRRWSLLARRSDRCGEEVAIGERPLPGDGTPVPVPAAPPGHAVLAEVTVRERWFDRVRSTLHRAAPVWLEVDGSRHRIVAATAPAGLILSLPPGDPSGEAASARSVALHAQGRAASVRFVAVPLTG